MFKLICDLTKEYYGSENETAITVLRYSDCNPCGAVGYNLTSSSNDNSLLVSTQVAAKWSMNALSPYNSAYSETYAQLLPKEDLSAYKYIGLFEDNNQFHGVIMLGSSHKVTPIYESIYNGDKLIWNKLNYLQFSASVDLQLGIFKQMETEQFGNAHIIDSYFLDYIKTNGWNECSSVESYGDRNTDNYADYVSSVKAQVKKKIIKELESTVRICKVDGKNIAMVGQDGVQQDIEDVCHQLGGKFPSIYETVEEICKGGVASKLSLLSFGNEVFSVTCENYQETLPEIGLGLAGTVNEEL